MMPTHAQCARGYRSLALRAASALLALPLLQMSARPLHAQEYNAPENTDFNSNWVGTITVVQSWDLPGEYGPYQSAGSTWYDSSTDKGTITWTFTLDENGVQASGRGSGSSTAKTNGSTNDPALCTRSNHDAGYPPTMDWKYSAEGTSGWNLFPGGETNVVAGVEETMIRGFPERRLVLQALPGQISPTMPKVTGGATCLGRYFPDPNPRMPEVIESGTPVLSTYTKLKPADDPQSFTGSETQPPDDITRTTLVITWNLTRLLVPLVPSGGQDDVELSPWVPPNDQGDEEFLPLVTP